MGTFAQGDVNIYFEKEEDANKVHEILSDPEVEKHMIKFLGEEGAGYYNFYDFSDNGSQEVYFQYSSGRVQNAEWQIERVVMLLKKLVKTGEIEEVAEFQSSLMMDAGSGIFMESSEFEEE